MEPNTPPSVSLPPTPPRSEPPTPSIMARGASKRRKQLGWAPPTLQIPTPQPFNNNSPYSASISMHGVSTPSPSNSYVHPRKASEYMFSQFNGIRDFTMSTAKSGLGIGEKCSFWCYNQLSKLSRRWFTHIFLTICIVIYTVGGALVFVTIEGRSENLIVADIRSKRRIVLEEIRNLSLSIPKERSMGEWHGESVKILENYELEVIDAYKTKKLIMENHGKVLWTFWNAVVYCSTIYTTIETMDTLRAPTDILQENQLDKPASSDVNLQQLEAMVTPEQVLSASMARKRRNITKRRSTSRTREQTPARETLDRTTSTTDEEVAEPRPKTPERRRRKVNKNSSGSVKPAQETDVIYNGKPEPKDTTKDELEIEDAPRGFRGPVKKESLVSISQGELLALFDKAKRKISLSRERYKKRGTEKRSYSSPRELTEDEVLEGFRKAQRITAERERQRKRSLSARKYSTDSIESSSSIERVPPKPKPYRPEVKEFVARKKQEKQRQCSNRIVEILDPKTSKVIRTKEIINIKFKLFDFIKVLRFFSVIDIYKEYRKFKADMREEYNKIRKERTKCINELLMFMIICGLGGVMFKFVEGAFENFYKCGVKRVKRDFIDNLWQKSHNLREDDWKSLARNKLRIFEEELHSAHEAGVHSYSGQRSWSFLNGIVYCLTVVTTIGYGHLYPTTTTGQGLTMLYALIGIPLFLIILTDFGKLFTRVIKFFWSFVRRIYYTGNCRRARKTAHMEDIFKGAQMMYEIATFRRPSVFDPNAVNPEAPELEHDEQGDTPTTPAPSNYEIDDEFNLPITLALSILVLYMFLGGVLFSIWEGWSFLTAFYFVFISMSTIGFGDYVPRHPVFMIISIVYLVFGLALMSMCINVVQDKLSDTFKQASAKIGQTIGLTVEDDGSVVTVPPDPVEMPEVHKTDATNEPNSTTEPKTA